MTFKKAPANLYEESIQSGAWNALGEVKDLERRINKRLQSEEFGKQDIESRIITMKELKKEWKELFDRYSTKWDESAWASPKKRMWDMQKNMEARMKTAERMQKSPFHIASKWAKRHFFNDQSR